MSDQGTFGSSSYQHQPGSPSGFSRISGLTDLQYTCEEREQQLQEHLQLFSEPPSSAAPVPLSPTSLTGAGQQQGLYQQLGGLSGVQSANWGFGFSAMQLHQPGVGLNPRVYSYTGAHGAPAKEFLQFAWKEALQLITQCSGDPPALTLANTLMTYTPPNSGAGVFLARVWDALGPAVALSGQGDYAHPLVPEGYRAAVLRDFPGDSARAAFLEAKIEEYCNPDGKLVLLFRTDRGRHTLVQIPNQQQSGSGQQRGSGSQQQQPAVSQHLEFAQRRMEQLKLDIEQAEVQMGPLVYEPTQPRPTSTEIKAARAAVQEAGKQLAKLELELSQIPEPGQPAIPVQQPPAEQESAEQLPADAAQQQAAESEDKPDYPAARTRRATGGTAAAVKGSQEGVAEGDMPALETAYATSELEDFQQRVSVAKVLLVYEQEELQKLELRRGAWDRAQSEIPRQRELSNRIAQLNSQYAELLTATRPQPQQQQQQGLEGGTIGGLVKAYQHPKLGLPITPGLLVYLLLRAAFEAVYVVAHTLDESSYRALRQREGQSVQSWGGMIQELSLCYPSMPAKEHVRIFIDGILDVPTRERLDAYRLNNPTVSWLLPDAISQTNKFVNAEADQLSDQLKSEQFSSMQRQKLQDRLRQLQRHAGGVSVPAAAAPGGPAGTAPSNPGGSGGAAALKQKPRTSFRTRRELNSYLSAHCVVHPKASHTNGACKEQEAVLNRQHLSFLVKEVPADTTPVPDQQFTASAALSRQYGFPAQPTGGAFSQPGFYHPQPTGSIIWTQEQPFSNWGGSQAGDSEWGFAAQPRGPLQGGNRGGRLGPGGPGRQLQGGGVPRVQGLEVPAPHPEQPCHFCRWPGGHFPFLCGWKWPWAANRGFRGPQPNSPPELVQLFEERCKLMPPGMRPGDLFGDWYYLHRAVVPPGYRQGIESQLNQPPGLQRGPQQQQHQQGQGPGPQHWGALRGELTAEGNIYLAQLEAGLLQPPQLFINKIPPHAEQQWLPMAAGREHLFSTDILQRVAAASSAAPAQQQQQQPECSQQQQPQGEERACALPRSFLQLPPGAVDPQPPAGTGSGPAAQPGRQVQFSEQPVQPGDGPAAAAGGRGVNWESGRGAEQGDSAAVQQLQQRLDRLELELRSQHRRTSRLRTIVRETLGQQRQFWRQLLSDGTPSAGGTGSDPLQQRGGSDTQSAAAEELEQPAALLTSEGQQQQQQRQFDSHVPELAQTLRLLMQEAGVTSGDPDSAAKGLLAILQQARGGKRFTLDRLINDSPQTGFTLVLSDGTQHLLARICWDSGATISIVDSATARLMGWRWHKSPLTLVLANATKGMVVGMTEPAWGVFAAGTPHESRALFQALVVDGVGAICQLIGGKDQLHAHRLSLHPHLQQLQLPAVGGETCSIKLSSYELRPSQQAAAALVQQVQELSGLYETAMVGLMQLQDIDEGDFKADPAADAALNAAYQAAMAAQASSAAVPTAAAVQQQGSGGTAGSTPVSPGPVPQQFTSASAPAATHAATASAAGAGSTACTASSGDSSDTGDSGATQGPEVTEVAGVSSAAFSASSGQPGDASTQAPIQGSGGVAAALAQAASSPPSQGSQVHLAELLHSQVLTYRPAAYFRWVASFSSVLFLVLGFCFSLAACWVTQFLLFPTGPLFLAAVHYLCLTWDFKHSSYRFQQALNRPSAPAAADQPPPDPGESASSQQQPSQTFLQRQAAWFCRKAKGLPPTGAQRRYLKRQQSAAAAATAATRGAARVGFLGKMSSSSILLLLMLVLVGGVTACGATPGLLVGWGEVTNNLAAWELSHLARWRFL